MALSGRQPVEFEPAIVGVTTELLRARGCYINASEFLDDAALASQLNAPVLSSTATRGGHLLGFTEVFDGVRGSRFDVCLTVPGQETRQAIVGRLQTQPFYLENLRSLAAHADHYLVELLNCGARARAKTNAAPPRPDASRSLALYPARLIARFASKALPRAMGRRLIWNVAAKSRMGSTLSVLQNPPGCFSADPFVIRRGDSEYCFVEEFSFARPKGIIVCYRIRDGLFERLGVALEEPFHLSFPFLIEANGELFMCPESSSNRDVRIYRCSNFPLEWSLETVALEAISAVDTIILWREGRWWMITCVNPLGGGAQFSELRIYTGNIVSGPWTPHALNPLRIDEVEARNGGFFEDAGKSYRVNQLQGFGVYGESIGINEIVQIDDEGYSERQVASPAPIARADIIGVHHLSRSGDTTVFDFSTRR
jgi:hypothetical protein